MASEPMTQERLAELRAEWADRWMRHRDSAQVRGVGELITEIDRLRAEVATLRDDLEHERRCAAAGTQPAVVPELSEPGPLVPDAEGWWWWRDARWLEWEMCRVTEEPDGLAWQAVGMPEAEPLESAGGEWGGRCAEPRR